MKVCVQCRHYFDPYMPTPHPYCFAPELTSVSLVTGYAIPADPYTARHDETSCGQEARYFQPKPDPTPRVSWWARLVAKVRNAL